VGVANAEVGVAEVEVGAAVVEGRDWMRSSMAFMTTGSCNFCRSCCTWLDTPIMASFML
jgi:hypothetical protein